MLDVAGVETDADAELLLRISSALPPEAAVSLTTSTCGAP